MADLDGLPVVGPVDVDTMFDRIRPDFLDCEAWIVVLENAVVRLSYLELSESTSLMRADYTIDLPFDEAESLHRPEVYFHASRPSWDKLTLPTAQRIGHSLLT